MDWRFLRYATCAVALSCISACSINVPWKNEPVGQEVNIAFVVQNNLLVLSSAIIDGRSGRFLFGSAAPQSVLDPHFSQSAAAHVLQLNQRESIRFVPVIVDLRGIGDAIVGADMWGGHAVTIDYRAGLLTFQREGIHPELMNIYRFTAEPSVLVIIDGRTVPAIVDTTSPDTLVIPRSGAPAGRRKALVQIAETDFGIVDIQLGDVAAPRIGNRLLSKFLVSIDYGRHEVGLWRDPRIAL